ncbi:T9SS type A sorting domain-containing protein, partial [candidate division WOR-3 bacterium]|nr:T9SS type A sorting domain-containing protein [candidate division WOR-3 bacterium]
QMYKLSGWHVPLSLDAGLMSLEGARGTIDSATTVTPHVTVRNFGTAEADIPVRLRIGSVYDEQRTKAIRGGAEDTVMFPDWTPHMVGTYPVMCTTGLAGDMFTDNDTWTEVAQVVRAGKDVGCNAIIAPAGLVDSGVPVVPVCSVYNYGGQVASYSVRMKVGALYDETTLVTGHMPGNFVVCSLPGWVPSTVGQLAVSCSTRLTGDRIPSNDRHLGDVTVRTQDLGVTRIVEPVGTVDSGTAVIPRVSVMNYGAYASQAPVWFKIHTTGDQLYEDSAWVSVGGGESLLVEFEPWVAGPPGALRLESYAELALDVNHANDTARGMLVVRRPVHDVGATAIIVPGDTVDTGAAVVPAALVRNYGERTETFDVRFLIGAFYSSDTGMTLAAGATDTVWFAEWHVSEPGTHAMSCSTMLAGDANPANDEVEDSVVVLATGIAGHEPVPAEFSLAAARPNPFTGRTRVRFGLPRESEVSVLVYNSAGMVVATLASGVEPAGWHEAVWADRAAAAGVYYCRMRAGEFTQTRKLLKTE